MKKKIVKRVLIITVALLLSVVLTMGIVIGAVWHNEISSVASVKMLVDENSNNKSAPVYIMDVKGGYYFDKFLEEGGAADDGELIAVITAAIAAYRASEEGMSAAEAGGFRVVSFKRASTGRAWNSNK